MTSLVFGWHVPSMINVLTKYDKLGDWETALTATIDGRDLIFGHKLHIGTPYRGKRFFTRQIPTSCLPKSGGIISGHYLTVHLVYFYVLLKWLFCGYTPKQISIHRDSQCLKSEHKLIINNSLSKLLSGFNIKSNIMINKGEQSIILIQLLLF
jgi:hypothetical protein